jgi:hypothetical protein
VGENRKTSIQAKHFCKYGYSQKVAENAQHETEKHAQKHPCMAETFPPPINNQN